MREVSYSDQPWSYITSLDRMLHRHGFNVLEIEIATLAVLELIIGLQIGSFPVDPHPVGRDPDLIGYHLYTFDTGELTGKYSSSGDKVRLLRLNLNMEALRALGLGSKAA